jgi:hypothetical protein
VYPSVVEERVRNGLKLKEISGIPWDHDGENGPTRD